jgi:Animal haem peroxidase
MKHHGARIVGERTAILRSPGVRGLFGRLFRNLTPWRPLVSDGQAPGLLGGLAGRMLEPKGAEGDPALDSLIPAGYTYFGQFVDHDLTFDPRSSLQRQNDPDLLEDFRTPRFDLDSLYGAGPDDAPFLYDKDDKAKFLIGKVPGTEQEDLPRNSQGIALVGDPRNDENVIVAQLHLAFLRFHNFVVDHVRATRNDLGPDEVFLEAQHLVRWLYQWVVIEDFLRQRIVGNDIVSDILRPGGEIHLRFYPEDQAFMPVEFSAAAYRMGHSMVRNDYVLNDVLHELRGKRRVPIFLPRSAEPGPLDDLRGGRPLPPFWTVQWEHFLDFGGRQPQRARKIDGRLSAALAAIPAPPGSENPLAFLNLLRGLRLDLPSGQAVARRIGTQRVFTNGELDLEPSFGKEAPLWFYILNEAERLGEGERLGPTGGRIVAETFLALVKSDPASYLNVEPGWRPAPPFVEKEGDPFQLKDIVRLAGVPIRAADLPFKAPI